jgi:redox-sensitive bicupin YhaK (pirin superfamily)
MAQRMSAGSGIAHTERNDAFATDPRFAAVPAHLIQVWLRPDTTGRSPSYAQAAFAVTDLDRNWLAIAAGPERAGLVSVDCRGATFWATRLREHDQRVLPDAGLRHLFVARGALLFTARGADTPLAEGDSVRIRGRSAYEIVATADAEALVWTFDGEDDGR